MRTEVRVRVVPYQAADEGSHVGGDVAGVRNAGRPSHLAFEGLEEDETLRRPPAVDGLLRGPRPGRDRLDGEPGVALLTTKGKGGVENREPGALPPSGCQWSRIRSADERRLA